jgi:hypothetical protein
MFKKILLLLTILTLLSCNVTKPVIVTKSGAFKFKESSDSCKNTNEVRPTLKKQQGQVDQDGEVIESTSVTYVTCGMYISQYKDIAMANIIYG